MPIEIQPLNELNIDVYLACGCNPKDPQRDGLQRRRMELKRAWVERMMEKGLGVRIAFIQKYPAGFTEFIPIEAAPSPVRGEQLLFITDIHVNNEDPEAEIDLEQIDVGKELIGAAEQYAREQGFSGLATLAHAGRRLAGSFFESLGFTFIEEKAELHLLWKPFKKCAQPSVWEGNFVPTVRTDGVHVDVIHTLQCPRVDTLELWRDAANGYGRQVSFKEHYADDRSLMDVDCTTGCMGVFVNGKRAPCRQISSARIKKIINESLLQIPLNDIS